jgi:ferritin
MVTKSIEKAINDQISREEESSRIYLAMASWGQVNGFPGAAEWLYAQVEEERMHLSKFIHYLNDRGGHAQLSALEKPGLKFKSLLDTFERVLKHEEYISQSINDLYAIAVHEKDFSTGNFLQWFITEQIEEESTVRAILDKIRLVGNEKAGLYQVDRELSTQAAAKRASLLAAATANSQA